MSNWQTFKTGIFKNNPVFIVNLGLCPTLATSTSLRDAIGMGMAATFVLVGSNVIVSAIRRAVPHKVRIPCYIVVIATFVTIVELFLGAYQPDLYNALGIFLPLIVVNCIVLYRAEVFASKNGMASSLFDGFGMGLGFTCAVLLLAFIREGLGKGTLMGYPVIPGFSPTGIMVLPPGGFMTMGLLLGFFSWRKLRTKEHK
ncbi:MAG: electron transport complex subunit E [bacterium]|nr:electron transport complex subunit E [bacterium]